MLDNIQLMEELDDRQDLVIYAPQKNISILAQLNKASGCNGGDFILYVHILGAQRRVISNEETKTTKIQFAAKSRTA